MTEQEKYFKGIIPPPIIFFAFVSMGFLGQWLLPLSLTLHSWALRLAIGFPLFILSGAIALNSFMLMRKSKTAINYNKPTTKFITKGPFRFTRNPLYLALLGAMVTIGIFSDSAWHLGASTLLFAYFNLVVIDREERYLENSFGDEYLQYKNKVRRWL
ncbi:MAG: isoprenylcysteine carboxylmethyltransferase family protein [Thermodesulfobacteriota bacterium]